MRKETFKDLKRKTINSSAYLLLENRLIDINFRQRKDNAFQGYQMGDSYFI